MPQSTLRGETHGRSLVTESQVREIRAATGTQAEIGARYGIHKDTVGNIRSRKTWKHVA